MSRLLGSFAEGGEEYERLRFIPLAVPRVQRTLGVLKLAERSLSPAAQAMEAFILATLGETDKRKQAR